MITFKKEYLSIIAEAKPFLAEYASLGGLLRHTYELSHLHGLLASILENAVIDNGSVSVSNVANAIADDDWGIL